MRFVINRLFKRPAKKIQRGRPAPRDRRPTAHMRRLRRPAPRWLCWPVLAAVSWPAGRAALSPPSPGNSTAGRGW